jgi:DUF1680 family protein
MKGGGFAAVSYAPCEVRFWSDKTPVRFNVDTAYPFEEEVRITVTTAAPKQFPIKLRIPEWAEGASIRLNGSDIADCEPGTYKAIAREWSSGDRITLHFPMRPRVTRWRRKTAAVELGPLLMAYQPKERWTKLVDREHVCDWAVDALSAWNWAIVEGDMEAVFEPERASAFGCYPAARVKVHAAPVPEWGMDGASCAAPPVEPAVDPKDVTTIELVPYGGTGLRISQLHMTKKDEIIEEETP